MSRALGLGIAVLCGCLLVAEVALTRIFSVTIWYHFAFLAISVALFGTGAASVGVHLSGHRLDPEKTGKHLGVAGILLGVTLLFAELVLLQVSSDWSQSLLGEWGKLFVLFAASSAPFLVGGFAVGLAMTRHAAHVHTLYFWDLAGAAVGCLVVIPAMDVLDAPRVLAFTAALAAASGGLLATSGPGPAWRAGRLLGPAVGVALAAVVLLAPGLVAVRWAKGERIADKHPEWNRWNSFSMVTVMPYLEAGGAKAFSGWGMSPRYTGPVAEQKALFIDLNAMTTLTRFRGDFAEVAHGLHDATAFVHVVRPGAKRVCVIGAGGGKDVLAALASGAEHVTAAELNPLIAEGVVRGAYADFTGGLYARPDVTLRLGDGRAIVRELSDELDLVHLSMVDTSAATAAGAYVLSENSLYTVEAFGEYLAKLRPGGMLSVSSVSLPSLAVGERLATLARAAAKGAAQDPAESVIVISTPWLALPNATLHNVILKKGAFTPEELERAREGAAREGFRATYLPGRAPAAKAGAEALFATILGAKDEAALRAGIDAWPVDVAPPTDDRPFFFYQNRLRDLVRMMSPMERTQAFPFGNGLFILAKVLLVALAMVGACILVPLSRTRSRDGGGGEAVEVSYVCLLGVGFMAVEIGLVQRVTLYLGRPSDGLAVVLFVLLAMGAVGSLRSSAPAEVRRRRLPLLLAGLVTYLVVVFQSGLFQRVLGATATSALSVRIATASVFLAPLGLFLGTALPSFLAAVGERTPGRVPWLWGLNGATSVLGSVLATLVAMHAGISGTLWLGTLAYAAAAVLARRA